MSLFALYLNQPKADREQVVDALSGNLCRCTGYRPIIDAALRMNEYPEPVGWSRESAQSTERCARLQAIQRDAASESGTAAGFFAPKTLAELAARYAKAPQSLILAGGTDIGLWVTKHLRSLPPLIYLGEVAELRHIEVVENALEIGAAVNLSDAFDAIVARYPQLTELANRFASVPIRNSGTLCGNIANGSPIGDAMPVLIALGAAVKLRCGDKTRMLALEDLYLGYQKKALAPGEFVQAVRVPLPSKGIVASYKISKRFDQDISAVCGGYALEIEAGKIIGARIAYGGMAAIPQRAQKTEAALVGKAWSKETITAAVAKLVEDYQPLSDMRASAEYRLKVAGNLLLRLYAEYGEAKAGTRVYAASETGND